MDDIETRARSCISEITGEDVSEKSGDTVLRGWQDAFTKKPETLGMDSLDGVELMMLAEEEFGIVISDDEADKITTIAELIASVRAHMKSMQEDVS